MSILPEESPEFLKLVSELETLVSARSTTKDKKAVLAAGARRFEIEQKLIALLSPAGRPTERRRNVRVPCALHVTLNTGEVVDARAVDVSFGGIRLAGTFTCTVGQKIQVTVHPEPGLLDQGAVTGGTVAWVREGQIGVFFQTNDPSFNRRVLLLVLGLLKRIR